MSLRVKHNSGVAVCIAVAWRLASLSMLIIFSIGASGQGTNDNISLLPAIDDHGIDAINLQNLTVMLNVPIRAKTGMVPFEYDLIGSSGCVKVFRADTGKYYLECGISPTGKATTFETAAAYFGFSASNLNYIAFATNVSQVLCPDGVTYTHKYAGWVVADSYGNQHPLAAGPYIDKTGTNYSSCYSSTTQGYTTDGSGIYLQVTNVSGSANYISSKMVDPHGGTLSIPQQYPYAGDFPNSARTYTDDNGNSLSSSAWSTGTTPVSYIDTLGTTALSVCCNYNIQGPPNGTFTWTDINGAAPSINLTYTSLVPSTWFSCAGITNFSGQGGQSGLTTPFTTGISYPDGGAVSLGYEQAGGGYTGRIASIGLKTGGTITYAYSGGNNGINCTYLVPPTLARTTQDGTTTYTWAVTNNGSGNYGNTTTVVDPGGNKTVYTFTGLTASGYAASPTITALTEIQKYQNTGTPSNPVYSLLTTDVICYNGNSNTSTCATAVVSGPINEKDTYHTIAGVSPSRTQVTYDIYGNTTSVANYDFGASSYTYKKTIVYGNWTGSQCVVLGTYVDRPCDIKTTDGTNTLAESHFSYDSHGNVLTKSVWSGSIWLNTSYTYNPNGTVATSTDVNNSQTTYSYAASGSGGCNGLLLTGITTVVSSGDTLTTSKTWDSACNGAVPVTSTDASGNITQYAYNDPYYRLTSTTDPLGYAKTLTYSSATVTNSHASFGSSVDDVTTYLDGLGRPVLAQKQQGVGSSNYDSISASYAWNGAVFQKNASMPCVQTQDAGCSSYFGYSTMDPLGRTLSTQDAGGGTATYTYSQNDAKISIGPAPAGEHTKNTQTEYDGLGRVKSTCQILTSGGSSCGQSVAASGYLTSYTYSSFAGGAKAVTTRGVQTRISVDDALGRVTSQTNPESGATIYVYDSASNPCGWGSFTNYGDLIQRTDANGNSVCYQHDSLHRVTDVGNSAQSSTNICKRFRYDNSTGVLGSIPPGVTVQNTMGHMVEAETDACFLPYSQSMLTDEWFSYDKDGRLTDVYELTPNSGGYYHTTVGYFPNGVVSSLSGLPGYAAYTYTVDGEGRPITALQGTTTLINGVTFNAASQPTAVQFGKSGDLDAYTYDPATGRMTAYNFTVNSVSESGTLTWNLNGSLRTLAITDGFNSGGTQTCNFGTSTVTGYDDLGRLVSDNCGSAWSQAFSYDEYDNLTKSGSITWNPGYNSSNNQYSASSGASYDATGNLLYDTFNTYTWNVYGKMASVTSGKGTVVCGTSGFCVTYDAFGRVVERNYQGTYRQVLYSPVGKTAIMGGQTVTNAYVPMPGGESSMYSNSTGGSGHYMEHHDWRGSVVLSSTLSTRTVDYDRAFAGFGEMYDNFGVTTKLNFTGDTQDIFSASPGLYDTPNRELHPNQGRWISPDPAGAGWNPYAYGASDPLDVTDLSGLDPRRHGRTLSRYSNIGNGCDWGVITGDPSALGSCDLNGTSGWWGEFDLANIPVVVGELVAAPGTTDTLLMPTGNLVTYTVGSGNVWLGPNGEDVSASVASGELQLPSLDPVLVTIGNIVILNLPNRSTGGTPTVASGKGTKQSLLGCTLATADKLTISNALGLEEGSWGRFTADALGGGNAFTGLIKTGQTLFGNSASGTDLAQAGAGILLDPSMGLGPALASGGMEIPSVVGSLTDALVEGGTGIGLAKLGYDALSLMGSFGYCAFTGPK